MCSNINSHTYQPAILCCCCCCCCCCFFILNLNPLLISSFSLLLFHIGADEMAFVLSPRNIADDELIQLGLLRIVCHLAEVSICGTGYTEKSVGPYQC